MKVITDMKLWKIWGSTASSEPIYFYATDFDEALECARSIDPDYNSGQVVEDQGVSLYEVYKYTV